MAWPQPESVAIDERYVVLECQCTRTIGEPDRIRDRDELGMAQSITLSCT